MQNLPAAIPLLDHGSIQLVDVMGSDQDIETAARVSYTELSKQEARTHDQTRGLLRHLLREWHTSPFEMASLKFHVRAPIFVARQWVRHRTGKWNEISGRYADLPEECYEPAPERIALQSTTNKQGSAPGQMADATEWSIGFGSEASTLHRNYASRLKAGMSRELARVNLPVSQYTEWVWKIDLHNLMHFLNLRLDSHAQHEIQVYAQAISVWVQEHFPITWEAFVDYRLGAETFSRMEVILIQEAIISNPTKEQVTARAEALGLVPREIRRLHSVLEFPSK